MQPYGQAQVLRRRPEGSVFGAAIGPLQPWIGGDQGPHQPEPPRPLQLRDPFLDLVQVDQGDALEPLRISASGSSKRRPVWEPAAVPATLRPSQYHQSPFSWEKTRGARSWNWAG